MMLRSLYTYIDADLYPVLMGLCTYIDSDLCPMLMGLYMYSDADKYPVLMGLYMYTDADLCSRLVSTYSIGILLYSQWWISAFTMMLTSAAGHCVHSHLYLSVCLGAGLHHLFEQTLFLMLVGLVGGICPVLV